MRKSLDIIKNNSKCMVAIAAIAMPLTVMWNNPASAHNRHFQRKWLLASLMVLDKQFIVQKYQM